MNKLETNHPQCNHPHKVYIGTVLSHETPKRNTETVFFLSFLTKHRNSFFCNGYLLIRWKEGQEIYTISSAFLSVLPSQEQAAKTVFRYIIYFVFLYGKLAKSGVFSVLSNLIGKHPGPIR